MRVLITGSDGFIGKNFRLRLAEIAGVEIISFSRKNSISELPALLANTDFVFHFAGVNRSKNDIDFINDSDFTANLAGALEDIAIKSNKKIPIVYTSSTQASLSNFYAQSKRKSELILLGLERSCCLPVYIFRLPNVFGKWAKPNYNSVVATFCYNIARNLPIQVHDQKKSLSMVYVDDLMDVFLKLLSGNVIKKNDEGFHSGPTQYSITLGDLAKLIYAFKAGRESLMIERVGIGLTAALYSTFISYLPPSEFSYPLQKFEDARGVFVEAIKTRESGQFSYFTSQPGVSRGGHYHHAKTEKFLVVSGSAKFSFKNIDTEEMCEIFVDSENPHIVDTAPGWLHTVTNVGNEELVVLVWVNQVFDRMNPDTYTKLFQS